MSVTTKHDWILMRDPVAAQTLHEMRYVLPGLSTCGATATEAYGGDRDVCGTIGRPMNSVMPFTCSYSRDVLGALVVWLQNIKKTKNTHNLLKNNAGL